MPVFEHGPVETIANWVSRKATPPDPMACLVQSSAESAELSAFADRLVQLRRWRTAADYDHLKAIARPEAVAACDGARQAIEALDAVYGEPQWMTFTTLVLLRGSRAAR